MPPGGLFLTPFQPCGKSNGRMAILPILRYPHEVLAVDSEPVREITPDIERLVRDMIETMHAAPGVGLAANQVGVALQVAVVDLSAGEKSGETLVLINPRVIESSGGYLEDEGCLSLPGFTERVSRPERTVIEAMDLEGKRRGAEGRLLMAPGLHHEIYHLYRRHVRLDRLQPQHD